MSCPHKAISINLICSLEYFLRKILEKSNLLLNLLLIDLKFEV